MAHVVLGKEDLAKYPFLPEVSDYLRSLGLDLETIANYEYAHVLERAKERVDQAFKGSVSNYEGDIETEIISFPVALLLVRALGMEHIIPKYALAEALRVQKLLENENLETIQKIYRSVFRNEFSRYQSYGGNRFGIPLKDYIPIASRFSALEWKLTNRILYGGYVFVSKPELIRLLRARIEIMIRDRIKELSLPKVGGRIIEAVKSLQRVAPSPPIKYEAKAVSPEDYPPCVVHAIEMLKKGENVSHYGRFLLTTYMLKLGKNVDDVLTLFVPSPDYNEKIAKYQVEHLAGLKGGRTHYNVPGCRTLATHNFCFKTEECDGIRNPIQFRRNLKRERIPVGRKNPEGTEKGV